MVTRRRILGRIVRIWRLEPPGMPDLSVVWRVRSGGRVAFGATRREAIRRLFNQILDEV